MLRLTGHVKGHKYVYPDRSQTVLSSMLAAREFSSKYLAKTPRKQLNFMECTFDMLVASSATQKRTNLVRLRFDGQREKLVSMHGIHIKRWKGVCKEPLLFLNAALSDR